MKTQTLTILTAFFATLTFFGPLQAQNFKSQYLGKAITLSSVNQPGKYITVRNQFGLLSYPGVQELEKKNHTFKIIDGLNGHGECISFELERLPGYFLIRKGNFLRLEKKSDSQEFKDNSSFKPMEPLFKTDGAVSFMLMAESGKHIRHKDGKLRCDAKGKSTSYEKDATFVVDGVYEEGDEKDQTITIEMMGRRGELTLPVGNEDSGPSTGLIKLYGAKKSNAETYILLNGKWEGDFEKFSADIRQADQPEKTTGIFPGLDEDVNKIRLLGFEEGPYVVVGVLTSDTEKWVKDKNAIVLGYEDKEIYPFKQAPSRFALVINDKHATVAKDDPKKYSYAWPVEPMISETPTFKTCHLVKDDMEKELALYAFENHDWRPYDVAKQQKVTSYKPETIMNLLKGLYPDVPKEYKWLGLRGDLAALLINDAVYMYPSEVLGLRSSGHGSPSSLMNGILTRGYTITRCLTWVENYRQKNIEFLDMGTNCNVSSIHNLEAVSQNVDYVVASDLTRSGVSTGKDSPSDGKKYATYFDGKTKDVKTILTSMLKEYDDIFNDADAQAFYVKTCGPGKVGGSNYYENETECKSGRKEQLTLFDMAAFNGMLNKLGGVGKVYDKCMKEAHKLPEDKIFHTDGGSKYIDFKTALPILYPSYNSLDQDWNKFVVYQINNKKGLGWETDKPSGILLKRKW